MFLTNLMIAVVEADFTCSGHWTAAPNNVNLILAIARHEHKLCSAVLSSMHIRHSALSKTPTLYMWEFSQQCPVRSPTIVLRCALLNPSWPSKNCAVLGQSMKVFACRSLGKFLQLCDLCSSIDPLQVLAPWILLLPLFCQEVRLLVITEASMYRYSD